MDHNFESPFRFLMRKDIYSILDGDTKFEDYTFSDNQTTIQISMPYLSGPDLCDLSTHFGLPVSYNWGTGGQLSRWMYLENLFKYCIKADRCTDLLSYLFSKHQFASMLAGHEVNVIDAAHSYFVKTIIGKINGILYFGSNELITVGGKFSVREIGTKVEVQTPKIKSIDREYIRDISNRAIVDVEQKNYDSAITKSRTLVEEVFCYVIELKNKTPSNSGNINTLYKQVKDLYNMHGDVNTDRRINTLLSGLEKIVSSVSDMRNNDSDAHGVGKARITIDEHHARLVVNVAMAMADFILSVAIKQTQPNR